MLELEERERSKDEGGQGQDIWLQELQDQIRNGRLSEDTGISYTVVRRSFQERGQQAPRSAGILLASPWRRLEQPTALKLKSS